MDQAKDRTADRPGKPTDLDAAGWFDAAKRAFAKAGDDNISLLASGIAFNAFLAFVPLISAVVLTYGLVASPDMVAAHIGRIAQALPSDAASIITGQLESIVELSSASIGLGLVATLAIMLYGAMRGASGMIVGLNIACNIDEGRPFPRQTLAALAITGAAILVFILASLAISAMNVMGTVAAGIDPALRTLIQIGFWLLAAAGVSAVIALVYRYAPNRSKTPWRWLTPGSIVATATWIAATVAFSFYVRNFGSYNATYGALGAIVILLTWFYLSAYILLFGAELNQALEDEVPGTRR